MSRLLRAALYERVLAHRDLSADLTELRAELDALHGRPVWRRFALVDLALAAASLGLIVYEALNPPYSWTLLGSLLVFVVTSVRLELFCHREISLDQQVRLLAAEERHLAIQIRALRAELVRRGQAPP